MIYTHHIAEDDELKQRFLELIRQGLKPNRAARELDSTGTQFRRLLNPDGAHHDPAFTEAYHAALRSDEHNRNLVEQLRDMQWDRAAAGDTRMIEKLSLIHDPDWEPLRHTNFRVDVNLIARMLPGLSDEELARVIEQAEHETVTGPALKLLTGGDE